MAKRSKTFKSGSGRTVFDGVVDYWNDLMSYDGTREDYYSDSWQIGIIDAFTNGYASAERDRIEKNAQLEYTMARFGINWSDIKYPTNIAGFTSASNSARVGVNFVSDNVRRLYR